MPHFAIHSAVCKHGIILCAFSTTVLLSTQINCTVNMATFFVPYLHPFCYPLACTVNMALLFVPYLHLFCYPLACTVNMALFLVPFLPLFCYPFDSPAPFLCHITGHHSGAISTPVLLPTFLHCKHDIILVPYLPIFCYPLHSLAL